MMLHRWLHGHVSYAEFGTPVQCLVINPVDPSWDRTSVSWRTFLSVDPFQSNGTLLIKKVACDFNTICFGEADWKKNNEGFLINMIAAYRSIVGDLPYLPSINPGGQRVILIPAHLWASSTSCAHFFAALAQRHSMAQHGAAFQERSQNNPAGSVAASHRNHRNQRNLLL